MIGGYVPRAVACGIRSNGMLFSGPSTSDGEVGWALPVLDSATLGDFTSNKDKMITADDDFNRVVRNKWRRHLHGLACNEESTTLRVWSSRYWRRWFDEMTFDGDDDFL